MWDAQRARACLQHVQRGVHIVGGRARILQLGVKERQLVSSFPAGARLACSHVQQAADLRHHPSLFRQSRLGVSATLICA